MLPLLAVQRVANAVVRHDLPGEEPDARFITANWMGLALGCAFFGFLGQAAIAQRRMTSLEYLSRVAEKLNQAPHEASDGVVLDTVLPEGGRLIYRFRVTDAARTTLAQTKPFLKTAMLPRVCRDPLLKAGVAVRVLYVGPDGDEVAAFDVRPRDCR